MLSSQALRILTDDPVAPAAAAAACRFARRVANAAAVSLKPATFPITWLLWSQYFHLEFPEI